MKELSDFEDNVSSNEYNQFINRLSELDDFTRECNKNIVSVLEGYKFLLCNGTKPNLDIISDHIIQKLTILVLSDLNINQLPDNHSLAVINIPNRREAILTSSTVELKLYLDVMLRARKYQLNDETINYTIILKLESLYNNLKDRISLELEKIAEDLFESEIESKQVIIIGSKIDEIKAHSEEILQITKQALKIRTLDCIESFVNHLQSTKNESLGIDYKGRFERVINVIRGSSYKLNLRNIKLGLIGNYLKELDLTDVLIELSVEQEDTYLTQTQRESRPSGRLFKAAIEGDLDEITNLIKGNKINVNCINSAGRTALMIAAFSDKVEVVKLLISFGAEVNQKTTSGKTLLEGLASLSASETTNIIIKELITAGAIVTVHVASMLKYMNLESFNTIWHIDEINRLENGYTALHLAVIAGQLENVKYLITKGAKLEISDQDGYNALHVACREGYKDIALILLEQKMNVNERANDNNKSTPISLAIGANHLELAVELFKLGAITNQGQGRLLRAYAENHPEHNINENNWQKFVSKESDKMSCRVM